MTAAEVAVRAGHAFVSFAHPEQMGLAVAACQSFGVDCGAYSAWRKGEPITDWSDYYAFAAAAKRQPACDFAVIPDVIDGGEDENDLLLLECKRRAASCATATSSTRNTNDAR